MLQRVSLCFLRAIGPVSLRASVYRIRERRTLIVRKPAVPQPPQFLLSQIEILVLAAPISDGVLALRIGDAFLRRFALNLVSALREFVDERFRHTGDFKTASAFLHGVSQLCQTVRKPAVERRFPIGAVPFDVAELSRLEASLRFVPGQVEGVTVHVQMRVRHTVYGTGGEMQEIRIDQVCRFAVVIAAIRPNARLHFTLKLLHGVVNAVPECVDNAVVCGELIQNGY